MTKFNKPIPAVLVHTESGVEYRIRGRITAINESNNTVSMKISGRAKVEHNIPMESVYLTEGILDSIKKAGQAIADGFKYLIRKIKGFLLPMVNGKPDYSVVNAPINIGILEANGQLPGAVHFIPNDAVVEAAEENGVQVANVGVDPTDFIGETDKESVENYWAGVMKEYVANESYSVRDAVKAVNERYIRQYNKHNAINEAVISQRNPGWNRSQYGKERGTKEMVGLIRQNILSQLSRNIGDPAIVPPTIIWGAPGIGKTVILSNLCNILREEEGLNLMFQTVQCSNLNTEDWGIPAIVEEFKEDDSTGRKAGDLKAAIRKTATNIPKTWLPVYELTDDEEENRRRDDFYNSGAFNPGNVQKYDGGIIFFDEYTRLPARAKNIMMALTDRYMYENMHMASKWCLVFAANRLEDVRNGDQADFIMEQAQADRFLHITYVPTKAEWLVWARKVNNVTGLQNIDEKYCAFIEASPDGVWYDALDLGARDGLISDENKKLISDYRSGQADPDAIQSIYDSEPGLNGQLTWTGRSWQTKVNNQEQQLLKQLFSNHPELLKSIYTKGNIDAVKLEQALNMLSPKEWNRWAGSFQDAIDPSGRMSRIAFYDAYITDYIINGNLAGDQDLPTVEWKTYNEYKKTFSPDVITSIWETGQMPSQKMRDDDNKFYTQAGNYSSTEISKWKKSPVLIANVFDLIFTNYPGGNKLAVKEIKTEDQFNNINGPLSPAVGQKLLKKYSDMYTVTVGKDKIPTLFTGNEDVNSPLIYPILITLENSEFARNVAHIAAYLVKIAIQSADNSVLEVIAKRWLSPGTGDFYQQLIAMDQSIENNILHAADIITPSIAKDKKAQDELFRKTLCAPATFIITKGAGRNTAYMAKGVY